MSQPTNPLEIQSALVRNYNDYGKGLDSKNWQLVRNCFADQVIIDYGDLSDATGSRDAPRQADDWIAVVQGVIDGFDITRHTITNHRFELSPDLVACTAYLTADHVIFSQPGVAVVGEQDVVTLVGEYRNCYEWNGEAWKICQSRLATHWIRGNLELLDRARELTQ